VKRLTNTSYAILGLLALKDLTTYELAQQMQRVLSHVWPRAESHLYAEPKNLVAHGLATSSRDHVGKRPRTTYAITRAGRAELRRWLRQPGRGPTLEFDGLLKAFFADQGSREDVLSTIAVVRADVLAQRERMAAVMQDIADHGGHFPKRLHVGVLTFRFLADYTDALLRWTRWAEEEVRSWPENVAVSHLDDPAAAYRELAESLRRAQPE
jgi:PadR family transcriptional regulator, regulatory protein AphA